MLAGEVKAGGQLRNMGQARWNFIEVLPDIPAAAFRHLRVADGTPEGPRESQNEMLHHANADASPGTITPGPCLRMRWNIGLHIDRKSIAGNDQRQAGRVGYCLGAEADLVHDQAVEPRLAQKRRQIGKNGARHSTNPIDGEFPGVESGPHGQLASQALPFAKWKREFARSRCARDRLAGLAGRRRQMR